MIRSRQHPLVKRVRAAARGERTRALLDGWHLLHDAAAARMRFELVAFSGDPHARDRAVLDRLRRSTEVVEVSEPVMDALSPVRTASGVIALVARPTIDLARVLDPSPALVLVAVDMQDPGNVGAMIRAAEAAGATGVVFTGASADPWGWKALRASMGSTLRLPAVMLDATAAACRILREKGLQLIAAIPRDGTPMHDADWTRPLALLLGGEGPGLAPELIALCDARVSIPMRESVESLNVAVASAVLLYEARRQRSQAAAGR